MFINVGLRASGKTYELIKKAAESNTPILVADECRAIKLKMYAMGLGFNIKCVYPVAIGIYISDCDKGDPFKGDVMVDDANVVLSELLHHNNIDEMNVTGMSISYIPDTFICQYPKKPEKMVIAQMNMNTSKEE